MSNEIFRFYSKTNTAFRYLFSQQLFQAFGLSHMGDSEKKKRKNLSSFLTYFETLRKFKIYQKTFSSYKTKNVFWFRKPSWYDILSINTESEKFYQVLRTHVTTIFVIFQAFFEAVLLNLKVRIIWCKTKENIPFLLLFLSVKKKLLFSKTLHFHFILYTFTSLFKMVKKTCNVGNFEWLVLRFFFNLNNLFHN